MLMLSTVRLTLDWNMFPNIVFLSMFYMSHYKRTGDHLSETLKYFLHFLELTSYIVYKNRRINRDVTLKPHIETPPVASHYITAATLW